MQAILTSLNSAFPASSTNKTQLNQFYKLATEASFYMVPQEHPLKKEIYDAFLENATVRDVDTKYQNFVKLYKDKPYVYKDKPYVISDELKADIIEFSKTDNAKDEDILNKLLKIRKNHRIEFDIKESELGRDTSENIKKQLRKDGVVSYTKLREIPKMTIEDFSGNVGSNKSDPEIANYFIKTLENFRRKGGNLYTQEEKDKAGRNLLHLAVKLDDIGLIKYLETKVPGRFHQYLDKKDKNGMSPLAYALKKGKNEISYYLHDKMKDRRMDTNEDIKKAFDSLKTPFSSQPTDHKMKQTELIRNYAEKQGLDVKKPGRFFGLGSLEEASKTDSSPGR